MLLLVIGAHNKASGHAGTYLLMMIVVRAVPATIHSFTERHTMGRGLRTADSLNIEKMKTRSVFGAELYDPGSSLPPGGTRAAAGGRGAGLF